MRTISASDKCADKVPTETEQHAALRLLHLADLVTPMALRAAATLRLVDVLAAGPQDVRSLADATGTLERPLAKLLAHLVAVGVIEEGPDGYSATPLGALLGSDHDAMGVRPMLDLEHVVGKSELALVDLLHTLRTGAAAFESRGRTLWQELDAAGAQAPGIEAFGRSTPMFDAHLVVEAFDWSAADSFVDVGGNTGALTIALLQAQPHLRGTVLDLPCFSSAAESAVRAAGVGQRCEVVGGSFFDELPTGRDIYLVSAILADWNDTDAVRILGRCRDAAGATGRVLVAEVHLQAAHPDPVQRTAAALRIEASMGHPDRTPDDIVALARRAGLDLTWSGPASPVRSLLCFAPARAGD